LGQNDTVPAVPVPAPVPQHWILGSVSVENSDGSGTLQGCKNWIIRTTAPPPLTGKPKGKLKIKRVPIIYETGLK
jgi:hypothetical protein